MCMVERAIVGYATLFGRSFSLILASRWLFYFWQFVSMAACILGPQSIVCGRLQNQVRRHIPIQSSSRHTSTEHKSTLCFLFVNFTSFINCEPSPAIWHTVSFHFRERNPIIICGPSISTADADSWINLSSPSILSTRDQPRYFSRAQSASCPKYFLFYH